RYMPDDRDVCAFGFKWAMPRERSKRARVPSGADDGRKRVAIAIRNLERGDELALDDEETRIVEAFFAPPTFFAFRYLRHQPLSTRKPGLDPFFPVRISPRDDLPWCSPRSSLSRLRCISDEDDVFVEVVTIALNDSARRSTYCVSECRKRL